MTLDALNVFSVFICLMEMYINSCVLTYFHQESFKHDF